MSFQLFPGRIVLVALVAGLSASLLIPSGCGGGTSTPTEDTIAPDDQLGTTTVSGTVVDASNTGTPVAGAYVYVPIGARGVGARDVHYANDRTDSQGAYTLERLPAGTLTIVIKPPAGSGFASLSIEITVGSGANITIRLTVLPQTVANQVASVTVAPANPTVETGATQQFTATILDQSGQAMALTPTWVTSGGVGSIDANGLFTASAAGTGTVTATAGAVSGTTAVTVQPGAASPVLSVTPTSLAFGSAVTTQTFAVSNTGGGTLTWSASSSDAWVTSVTPGTGTNAGTVTVSVSRTGLTAGDYTGTVAVTSNGGSATVGVTMTVAQASAPEIVFESSRGGEYEIYVMAADGSGQTNLTNFTTGDDEDPEWSPDGTKIAFASQRQGAALYDVCVMNADGTGFANLTNTAGTSEYGPTWSPDGTRIAFVSDAHGQTEIYRMNADGSGLTRLTDTPGNEYDPAWSPLGGTIAIDGRDNFTSAIVLIDENGGGWNVLYNSASQDRDVAWSADGSRLAWCCASDGWGEIYTMLAAGTGATNLTNDAGSTDSDPTWSPDGTRIAWAANYGRDQIYVMNADGSSKVALTNAAGQNRDPDWRW